MDLAVEVGTVPTEARRLMGSGARSTQLDALLGVCSTVRGLLADAERDEVRRRHEVGELLARVKRGPDTYGEKAIERVAEEIGVSTSMLYKHIAVAEKWSPGALRGLLEKTTPLGQPLTWSHLVALARVKQDSARALLEGKCLAQAWSVRDLNHHIDQQSESGLRTSDAAKVGEPVRAALKEGIQSGGRAIGDLRLFEDSITERLAADEPVDDALLARAVATLQELRDLADSALAKLRGARDSHQRLRVAAPARVAVDETRCVGSEDFNSEPPPSADRRLAIKAR